MSSVPSTSTASPRPAAGERGALLHPEEPDAAPWHVVDLAELCARLASRADAAGGLTVAVDGRAGAGKSSLVRRMARLLPRCEVRGVVGAGPAGNPTARPASGPAGVVVLLDGSGSSRLVGAGRPGLLVWVQADRGAAEHRALTAAVLTGPPSRAAAAVAACRARFERERSAFASARPWERADVLVSGTPTVALTASQIALGRAVRTPAT